MEFLPTMMLEYLPTFTTKIGPNVGRYSIPGVSGKVMSINNYQRVCVCIYIHI